jgi:hypothetical protein
MATVTTLWGETTTPSRALTLVLSAAAHPAKKGRLSGGTPQPTLLFESRVAAMRCMRKRVTER